MMWEYKIIELEDSATFMGGKFDLEKLNNSYNDLGREGWELVSVASSNQTLGNMVRLLAFFKRKRVE